MLLVAGCTRTASGGTTSRATPLQIYTAGLTIDQVRSTMDDDMWWPGAPTFGVRPLDLELTPETVRFSITQRYVHIGSGDTMKVDYDAYASVAAATTFMNNLQTSLGSNVGTTPKAGDQVLYFGQKLPTSTALYETDTVVRVGQIAIVAAIQQGSGFVDTNRLAKIANELVSRVKDVLANKVKPNELTSGDEKLLPPMGDVLTLVGVAKLPVEVVADMLQSADSQGLTATFTDAGVQDLVYGDYALDSDLHMEVRAAAFTFSSPAAATTWIDDNVGKSNLDSSGVAFTYADALKQYIAVMVAGPHIGLMLCKSTLDTEAASRACEASMVRVIPAWQTSLAAA